MLAKAFDKVKKSTIDNEEYWYASRKIDGVRCSFYWNGSKIVTASRGGGNYDPACIHFTQHPQFIEFFQRHPEVILDLELYKHGRSLQQISGAARLEKNAYDCKWLEGYIYDVMYSNVPFKTRLKILNQISKELNLSFDHYRHWEKGELQLQMVPHVKVSGYDNIMELHNKYVEEGFEGVVIRNPNKPYGFGKRTNDMIKIKCYKDDCFIVVDAVLGLRGSEDMVFICETKDGKTFKAKPLGDREQKEEYWNNFEQKYKGRLGECKFFYYSDEGVPLQPAFKAFRYDI
jgi:DNA ligase-1